MSNRRERAWLTVGIIAATILVAFILWSAWQLAVGA